MAARSVARNAGTRLVRGDVKTLNLLVLRCRDVERSRSFYELLGMRFERHQHGKGPEHLAHEDERGVFELYPLGAEAVSADQTGLGFVVTSLDASRAEFESRGFKPGAVRDNPWGRTFVVRDPDGRRVELNVPGV